MLCIHVIFYPFLSYLNELSIFNRDFNEVIKTKNYSHYIPTNYHLLPKSLSYYLPYIWNLIMGFYYTSCLFEWLLCKTILYFVVYFIVLLFDFLFNNWRPTSLSELTPMLFNMWLTHLGSIFTWYNFDLYSKNNLI